MFEYGNTQKREFGITGAKSLIVSCTLLQVAIVAEFSQFQYTHRH